MTPPQFHLPKPQRLPREYLEQHDLNWWYEELLRLLPHAGPGIAEKKKTIVYREVVTLDEARSLAAFAREGDPKKAFLTHPYAVRNVWQQITPWGIWEGFSEKPIERNITIWRKEGKYPLEVWREPTNLTNPHVNGPQGVIVLALVFPSETPELSTYRPRRRRHGSAASLFLYLKTNRTAFFDAHQIEEVLIVPRETLSAINARVRNLAESNVVGYGWGGYTDRDHDLAYAAQKAVEDLRVPPGTLDRPFLEVPVPLYHLPILDESGNVQGYQEISPGDRVLFASGEVLTLTGLHKLWTWENGQRETSYFAYDFKGLSAWFPYGELGKLRRQKVFEPLIVRVLKFGERVLLPERKRTWEQNAHRFLPFAQRKLDEILKIPPPTLGPHDEYERKYFTEEVLQRRYKGDLLAREKQIEAAAQLVAACEGHGPPPWLENEAAKKLLAKQRAEQRAEQRKKNPPRRRSWW